MQDPRVPGGRYFCGYWHHEYRVDAMFTTVYRAEDDSRWIPGTTFFDVTWIPTEDATHPRASDQWRGDGYHQTRHCTSWDKRDEIITQP